MRLKNKNSGVPGGFRYYQAETSTLITAPHWYELSNAVRRHRDANRIPLGDHEVEIEEQLAAEVHKVAPHFVDDEKPEAPTPPPRGFRRSRSWAFADVARFTATMVDSWIGGSPRVSQEEADRRGGICAPCPSNVPLTNCQTCGGLNKVVATALAKLGGTTRFDDQLHACEFCGCLNKAQIWFPKETLARHMPEEMIAALPDFCWKGKDVTNPAHFVTESADTGKTADYDEPDYISDASSHQTVYHESVKEITDMNKIFVGDGPDDTDDRPIGETTDSSTTDPVEARKRKVNKMFPEVVPIPPELRNLKGGDPEMKKTKKGSKKKGM